MNYLLKKCFIVVAIILSSQVCLYAATLSIIAPSKVLANRDPVVIQIMLDAKTDTISGISGDFSYDTDLFGISNISIEDSVVSLWVKQPTVSNEIYLDGRTHITFEGIFPGGYSGVRSPYYDGERSGRVMIVTLIPKNKGVGTFMVDTIQLNAYNREATPLATESVIQSVVVPNLVPLSNVVRKVSTEVQSSTLVAFITHDPLVNNDAWYLVVQENGGKSAVETMYVAETDDWSALLVDESQWKIARNEYILLYQNRTKYVHLKVVYANGTYALTTLPPVENSKGFPLASRILLGVALALLGLYFYVIRFSNHPSKQPHQAS